MLLRLATLWFCILFPALLVSDAVASSSVTSGPHLADVNILLPPKMTHPVEYRLQGTDGCFKWYFFNVSLLLLFLFFFALSCTYCLVK